MTWLGTDVESVTVVPHEDALVHVRGFRHPPSFTPLSPSPLELLLRRGVLESTVAYDDLKEFRGQVYSGMPIGGSHVWEYPHGLWQERKVAPDRWEFTFSSEKKRARRAPEGSGAPAGTQYHWFILAHQRVRKLDQDTYETLMEGVKFKVAHKRPHWRGWSTEYPDHEPEREILIRILEEQLAELKSENSAQSTE